MLSNAGISQEVFLIDPDLRKESSNDDRSKLALEDVYDAISRGINFGYSATCGGGKVVLDLIKKMKAKNYHVIISIVYSSLPTALERIRKRTHQPVPEGVVEDLHAFFKTKAEKFMKLDVEIYLYNNETEFNLLLSKKHKKIVCRHKDLDFYFDISGYCGSS